MDKLRCKLKELFQNYEDKELIVLAILGFICLIHICFSLYFPAAKLGEIDTAIRSQLITIFGYIFGSQEALNRNIDNKCLQLMIASIVAFSCLIFLIAARWLNGDSSLEGLVIIRDLMVSSTGFIIGRIKNKS